MYFVIEENVPECAWEYDWVRQGKGDNVSVRGGFTIFSVLTKYVVGRNCEETDEVGEITRLNGYHEEVLLLFNFLDLTLYPAFNLCAIKKT